MSIIARAKDTHRNWEQSSREQTHTQPKTKKQQQKYNNNHEKHEKRKAPHQQRSLSSSSSSQQAAIRERERKTQIRRIHTSAIGADMLRNDICLTATHTRTHTRPHTDTAQDKNYSTQS